MDRFERARKDREEIRERIEDDLASVATPKAILDVVWRLAWEHGHSSGESEIRYYYDDFMDVYRPVSELYDVLEALYHSVDFPAHLVDKIDAALSKARGEK